MRPITHYELSEGNDYECGGVVVGVEWCWWYVKGCCHCQVLLALAYAWL